jgi:cellulose 1,4-beta-cellobiosidase
MNEQKCREAASTYRSLTSWALRQLDLPNVAIYLDAGHAGWLGWDREILFHKTRFVYAKL